MTTRRGGDHNPATLNSLSPPPPRLGEILVQARVVTDELLQEALVRAGEERQRLGETLAAMGAASADDVLKAVAAQQELPYLAAEELPSNPPVNLLIDEALAADASDIHIEPFEDSLRVRYRIDGLLYTRGPTTRWSTATSRWLLVAARTALGSRPEAIAGRGKASRSAIAVALDVPSIERHCHANDTSIQ